MSPKGPLSRNNEMSAISCHKIIKRYGDTQVVHQFDLDVSDNEFVVFLGPSGCGKSTILRMLAGLEDISDGDLMIGGQRVNDLPPQERGIAMVFQNYALYPHMSVRDNIAFGLKRLKVPKAEIDARIKEVSDTLGLERYLQRKPTELSGGQQQRMTITPPATSPSPSSSAMPRRISGPTCTVATSRSSTGVAPVTESGMLRKSSSERR